jgi:flagellar FliL protein
MAKKKKDAAPEADAEAPEGGEAPEGAMAEGEGSKKGLIGKLLGNKILLFGAIGALVLVIGGGVGAYFFLFSGGDEQAVEEAHVPVTPPEVAFYDVPDILVNIQSADGNPAYLKLAVSLEMENEEEKTGMTALMPRLVDQFQAYLRELRMDDLKGSAGIARVKEELLRRVNVAAAPYRVRDVLLKEMIVQ